MDSVGSYRDQWQALMNVVMNFRALSPQSDLASYTWKNNF
jgi:hypothetical protein